MRAINNVILHPSGQDEQNFHFVIRENGKLERKRPVDQPGAHTPGRNADSLGICLCGPGTVTPPQVVTVRRILKKVLRQFPFAEIIRVGEIIHDAADLLKIDGGALKRTIRP